MLGANGAPLDDHLFSRHSELWLSIEIDGDELEPRFQLSHVPWAASARSAAELACSGCVGAGAVDESAVQLRVSTTCSVGAAIRVIHADGTVECEENTSYAAGSGLALSGTTLSVAPDTGECLNEQVLKFDAALGWVCANDRDTNTVYTAGRGIQLAGATFSLRPDTGSLAFDLEYSIDAVGSADLNPTPS